MRPARSCSYTCCSAGVGGPSNDLGLVKRLAIAAARSQRKAKTVEAIRRADRAQFGPLLLVADRKQQGPGQVRLQGPQRRGLRALGCCSWRWALTPCVLPWARMAASMGAHCGCGLAAVCPRRLRLRLVSEPVGLQWRLDVLFWRVQCGGAVCHMAGHKALPSTGAGVNPRRDQPLSSS